VNHEPKCLAPSTAPRQRPRRLREYSSNGISTVNTNMNIYSVEDFDKAKALAHSAAKSGAYLYPIKVRSPTHTPSHSLTPLGHLLLPLPSHIMEAPSLQACSYHDPLRRCHIIYVHLYLRPTGCRAGLR
jgi:hypothetical protein